MRRQVAAAAAPPFVQQPLLYYLPQQQQQQQQARALIPTGNFIFNALFNNMRFLTTLFIKFFFVCTTYKHIFTGMYINMPYIIYI